MQLTDTAKMASSLLHRRKVACGRFRSKLDSGTAANVGSVVQPINVKPAKCATLIATSGSPGPDASRHVLELPLSGSPRAVVQNIALA